MLIDFSPFTPLSLNPYPTTFISHPILFLCTLNPSCFPSLFFSSHLSFFLPYFRSYISKNHLSPLTLPLPLLFLIVCLLLVSLSLILHPSSITPCLLPPTFHLLPLPVPHPTHSPLTPYSSPSPPSLSTSFASHPQPPLPSPSLFVTHTHHSHSHSLCLIINIIHPWWPQKFWMTDTKEEIVVCIYVFCPQTQLKDFDCVPI